jgi:hypothetical protein
MLCRKRLHWRLIQALYDHGFSGEQIRAAYRVLSWMMRLPRGLQLTFREKIVEFERTNRMPYITDIEELGIEQGIEQGIERVTLALLERVCGGLTEAQRERVEKLPVAKAEQLALALLDFRSGVDLDAWLRNEA